MPGEPEVDLVAWIRSVEEIAEKPLEIPRHELLVELLEVRVLVKRRGVAEDDAVPGGLELGGGDGLKQPLALGVEERGVVGAAGVDMWRRSEAFVVAGVQHKIGGVGIAE